MPLPTLDPSLADPAPSLRPQASHSTSACHPRSPHPHLCLLSASAQALFTGETGILLQKGAGRALWRMPNHTGQHWLSQEFWLPPKPGSILGLRQLVMELLPCVRCSPSTSSRTPQLPFHPPCPPANTGLTPTEGVQPLGAHGSSPRGPRSDPSITPKRPEPNTHLLRKAVPDF